MELKITIRDAAGRVVRDETVDAAEASQSQIDEMVAMIEGGCPASVAASAVLNGPRPEQSSCLCGVGDEPCPGYTLNHALRRKTMTEFIEITTNSQHEHITSPMPPDETIVEVRMRDGTVRLAWFSRDIMEAGDFDFLPIEEGQDEPELECESIADDVAAWRRRSVL